MTQPQCMIMKFTAMYQMYLKVGQPWERGYLRAGAITHDPHDYW